MHRLVAIVLATAISLMSARSGLSCTTVGLFDKDRAVVAYNFDWYWSQGLVFVNKRGVRKTSWVKAQGATWTSRYGSVTFSQLARDTAITGLNEKGLMGALMKLRGTRYPPADERPVVHSSEWIQFNLDMFSTVAEVVANAEKVRPVGTFPNHFFFADASGDAATIEFLAGRLVVHRGDSLPVKVLANSTYSRSLAAFEKFHKTGLLPAEEAKTTGVFPEFGSLDRFVRGALHARRGRDPIAHGFAVLDEVKQGMTKWSIVYDLTMREVYLKTHSNASVRRLRVADFDLSCRTPVKILDITTPGAGNVGNAFVPYTRAANRALVEIQSPDSSPDFKARLAAHPERTSSCTF